MSTHRKYAELSDLDVAPVIYETPELTDDTSTRQTGTSRRSNSRTSSEGEPQDDNTLGIDRQRLDPDQARIHFRPSHLEARGVDFSDRISSKRKSYRASSRRSRKKQDHGDGTKDSTDEEEEEEESFDCKIARLRREVEEAKDEFEKRRLERSYGQDSATQYSNGDNKPGVDGLSDILRGMQATELEENSKVGLRLAQRLKDAATAPNPSSVPNIVSEPLQQKPETPFYTVSYAPEYPKDQALATIADFDARLVLLESVLGINAIPLGSQGRAASKPILPTLDTLDKQVSIISASSAALDAVGKKVHQLTQDAAKLNEARKLERAAQDATKSSIQRTGRPTSANEEPKAVHNLEDPELVSKIQALYGTLATIESLAPLLPSVLDRLRSLRNIHADAAQASEALTNVERRQEEMAADIRSWSEGLEKVEQLMKEGEQTMRGNVKVVEGWVKELEHRMEELGPITS